MYSPPEPDFNYKDWRNRMLLRLATIVVILIVGALLAFIVLGLRF